MDADGVFDASDQCLDTPPGEPVDGRGCSASQRGEGDATIGAPLPDDTATGTGSGTGSASGSRGSSGGCGVLGLVPLACLFLGLTGMRTAYRRLGQRWK
jgi:hypothetical protein